MYCSPQGASRRRSELSFPIYTSSLPSSLSVAFSSFPRRRKGAMHLDSLAPASQRTDWRAGRLGSVSRPFASSPLSSSLPSLSCSRRLASSSSSPESSAGVSSSTPLSPYRLQRAATSSAFGLPINCLHFDELDSTQKWCLRSLQTLCDEHGLSPSLWVAVSATQQTAAVGTRASGTHEEKKWVSPVNNVSVTYVIPWPVSLTSRLLNFAQTASAAVCKVLEEYQIRGQIKWINDVLVEGRKICGVLCHNPAFFLPSFTSRASATRDTPSQGILSTHRLHDLHAENGTRQQYIAVLVGIGINVEKNPDLSCMGILQQPVTSMAEEVAKVSRGGLWGHVRQEERPNPTGGRGSQILQSENAKSGQARQARRPGCSNPREFAGRLFPRDGEQRGVSETDERTLREVPVKAVASSQLHIGEDVSGDGSQQGAAGNATEEASTRRGSEKSAECHHLDMHAIRASLDVHMYDCFTRLQRDGFKALRPYVLSRLAWVGDYVELEEEQASACSRTEDLTPVSSTSLHSTSGSLGALSSSSCPSLALDEEVHSQYGADEDEADGDLFTDVDGFTDSGWGKHDGSGDLYLPPVSSGGGASLASGGRRLLASGVLHGLDEDGALLIRSGDGRTRRFLGGHLVRL
ncbi:biotin [Cystoisospora suis]|uniref:Biotin n=1 Tax=Cystoisospora suis TaxID=483139 RepID=A0A2C6KM01_9APIC|nr:biotin [Cystoisospora suis]